jgi:sporulation protein YlmC with PRC-barrel domain
MSSSRVWLATALVGDRVRNSAGENLGKIEDLVIDPDSGTLRYAVLSLDGVFGNGDRLLAIPWSLMSVSPLRDNLLLNIDKLRLERAPAFGREHWPDVNDPAWQRSLHDYYGAAPPVVRERTVYVESRPRGQGLSVLGTILVVCILFALVWVAYLVGTRGWDQARQDIANSIQGAAYAAKETSYDAALTAKVKTALALSKRIPSNEISVDSQGDAVTLRGEVSSEEVRHLAETITLDVPGVREVNNHLYVEK